MTSMSLPIYALPSAARPTPPTRSPHLLCFEPLLDTVASLCFPCNERGEVPLDELGTRERINYLFARATVGQRYARPVVQPSG